MKKQLDPTNIRPELFDEYRAAAAMMKSASDAFQAANRAYHALTVNPSLSLVGMGVNDRYHAFEQFQDDHRQRVERRIAAKDAATARYLEWQEAKRTFFAVCDQMQEEAVS